MIATTHFEPTGIFPTSDYMRLLDLWRLSWERQGFTCIVTGSAFIESRMDYPLVREFCGKVDSFPSANGAGFDRASFRRWIAAYLLSSQFGYLCVSESDVINYSLTSKGLKHPLNKFNIDDVDGCPSFAFCGINSLNYLVNAVVRHEVGPQDSFQGRPHLSDQDFIYRYCSNQDWYNSIKGPVRSVFSDGWKESSLVHYGTPFFINNNVETGNVAKVDLIQQLKAL